MSDKIQVTHGGRVLERVLQFAENSAPFVVIDREPLFVEQDSMDGTWRTLTDEQGVLALEGHEEPKQVAPAPEPTAAPSLAKAAVRSGGRLTAGGKPMGKARRLR